MSRIKTIAIVLAVTFVQLSSIASAQDRGRNFRGHDERRLQFTLSQEKFAQLVAQSDIFFHFFEDDGGLRKFATPPASGELAAQRLQLNILNLALEPQPDSLLKVTILYRLGVVHSELASRELEGSPTAQSFFQQSLDMLDKLKQQNAIETATYSRWLAKIKRINETNELHLYEAAQFKALVEKEQQQKLIKNRVLLAAMLLFIALVGVILHKSFHFSFDLVRWSIWPNARVEEIVQIWLRMPELQRVELLVPLDASNPNLPEGMSSTNMIVDGYLCPGLGFNEIAQDTKARKFLRKFGCIEDRPEGGEVMVRYYFLTIDQLKKFMRSKQV